MKGCGGGSHRSGCGHGLGSSMRLPKVRSGGGGYRSGGYPPSYGSFSPRPDPVYSQESMSALQANIAKKVAEQRSWQQPIPLEEYHEEIGGDRPNGKQDIYGGYNYSGNIFQTPDGVNQDHSHEVLRPDGSTEYKRDYKGNRIV